MAVVPRYLLRNTGMAAKQKRNSNSTREGLHKQCLLEGHCKTIPSLRSFPTSKLSIYICRSSQSCQWFSSSVWCTWGQRAAHKEGTSLLLANKHDLNYRDYFLKLRNTASFNSSIPLIPKSSGKNSELVLLNLAHCSLLTRMKSSATFKWQRSAVHLRK